MSDRVLLDRARKCLDEWERDAEEKATPGKPKEYQERFEEEMRSHAEEMEEMLPGLRARRDQLQAEREADETNGTGPSTNESNDELDELDEIISTFEMYI